METIQGRGVAPALVLLFVQRLPDTSLTHAFEKGGWEHFGWGQDRHIAADTYDAITFNTEATGHWEKPPGLPQWPRPSLKQESTPEPAKKKRSVKDFYAQLKK